MIEECCVLVLSKSLNDSLEVGHRKCMNGIKSNDPNLTVEHGVFRVVVASQRKNIVLRA